MFSQKSRENGQIFAKFQEKHEYFLENTIYFSRKRKTPIFAKILQKFRFFLENIRKNKKQRFSQKISVIFSTVFLFYFC
jgi:hypothetical protein